MLALAPGLVVVDEAYGQFASWSSLSLLADDRPLVVTRTFSKTWSMAACRHGLPGRRRRPSWPPLERVVLPYHLDAATQIAGRLALRFQAEMEARVAALVAERERLAGRPGRPAGRHLAVGVPTSCSSGRCDVDGATVWKGLVERSVLVRDCSSWPRLAGCLRVTVGTPDEDDAFLSALRGGPRLDGQYTCRDPLPRHQGDVDRDPPRPRRDGPDPSVATGLPFFDHMVSQLGRHGGFDLELNATGDLHVDAHHTVEDVGIALGECLREALGDKAGVRRFASISLPLDEALIEVALDLSGRPYLHYEVEPGGERAGQPPLRPPAGRGVLAGVRHLRPHHPPPAHAQRQELPPHPGGVVQGRGPGPARRRPGRGRGGAVHQGLALTRGAGDIAGQDRPSVTSCRDGR